MVLFFKKGKCISEGKESTFYNSKKYAMSGSKKVVRLNSQIKNPNHLIEDSDFPYSKRKILLHFKQTY